MNFTFFAIVWKWNIFKSIVICISSNTFSEVQEKSDQIWKYERYNLVIEYYNRPGLIPPFILLAHIWSLLTYIYRNCMSYFKETKPQITNELRKWHYLIEFFPKWSSFLFEKRIFCHSHKLSIKLSQVLNLINTSCSSSQS